MAYVYKPNQRLALFNQYKGDLLLGTGNSLFVIFTIYLS